MQSLHKIINHDIVSDVRKSDIILIYDVRKSYISNRPTTSTKSYIILSDVKLPLITHTKSPFTRRKKQLSPF